MSDATIDLTKRARIRALAARIHRAQIAGALSVSVGALAVDEGSLSADQRIEAIDADNKLIVGEIERLSADRARVARHHQPKVDRAEKQLRRLVYLAGGATDGDTDAGVASADSQGGQEER